MNYYEILGVSKTASKKEIKNAYRQLAIEWHPDKNPERRAEAEKKFKEITLAYKKITNSTEDIDDNETEFNPYTIFKDLFEEYNNVPNVIVPIELNLQDLYYGCTVEKEYTRYSECNSCNKNGTADGNMYPCANCRGNGVIIGECDKLISCDSCNGIGIDSTVEKCGICFGYKYYQEKVITDVIIPAGAYNRYTITVENEGNSIPIEERKEDSRLRSDVMFVIDEIKNKIFKRGLFIPELNRIDKADLLVTIDISFEESICGTIINIKDLNNQTLKLSTSEYIRHGDVFIVPNKGMPCLNSNNSNKIYKYGDLFIKFLVERPKLKKNQKLRIWQLITGKAYPDPDRFNGCENIIPLSEYNAK